MRTPHSSTNKGKRVKITLRDGTVLIGKFKDKKSGMIILEKFHTLTSGPGGRPDIEMIRRIESDRRIHMSDVRAFSIYKPTCPQTLTK
jgi:hypothetical protein